MITTLFLTVILVAIAFVLLAVKVLFVKGGRFPSGHVHDLPQLRRRGLTCAAAQAKSNKKKQTEYNIK